MRKICAISFSLFALSTLASAQLPKGGNVFFGYSYVHGETFANSRSVQGMGGGINMSGRESCAEGKYLPWLGLVADFDWHYGGRSTTSCSGATAKYFG